MESTDNSLFRNSRFLKLWIGQGISFVGDAISMIALVILVVRITGSASAVGGLLVAQLLPTLASPLVGVLADRLDRRVVLVSTDLARAALLVGVIFTRDLFVLYVLAFSMGVARTFFNPTVRAAFPSVVGGGDLTRANAIISGTFSVCTAVGPALGGVVVATAGINAAFVLDAATFLVSAAFLSRIPLPSPQREESSTFILELRDGFSYLKGARVPMAVVVSIFLTVLTVNLTEPAEIFLAKRTFDSGDAGYGLLVTVWGGGMVLGSMLIGALGRRTRLLPTYFLGLMTSAFALVATGASPTFAFALAALMVAGACNGIKNVASDTILQERVPDHLLGRVFATKFLAFSGGEVLAYPLGGFIVDAAGPRSTYLLSGALTAAAVFITLLILVLTSANRRESQKTPHE